MVTMMKVQCHCFSICGWLRPQSAIGPAKQCNLWGYCTSTHSCGLCRCFVFLSQPQSSGLGLCSHRAWNKLRRPWRQASSRLSRHQDRIKALGMLAHQIGRPCGNNARLKLRAQALIRVYHTILAELPADLWQDVVGRAGFLRNLQWPLGLLGGRQRHPDEKMSRERAGSFACRATARLFLQSRSGSSTATLEKVQTSDSLVVHEEQRRSPSWEGFRW